MGVALLTLVVFWAFINGDTTKQNLAKSLSSKTVLIEKSGNSTSLKIIEVSPVVAIPPTNGVSIKPETIKNNTDSNNLVSAPIPGLYESTDDGLIPIIRQKDGLTPFDAYKKPSSALSDKIKVSFVINDVGLSKTNTYNLIKKLPDSVTLAFSPYAQGLNELVGAARSAGHEVWLNLPLESKDYPLKDPGPFTLLKNVSEEQNKERLMKLLASASGYVGFIPNKDHVYDSKTVKTSPTLNEIYTRGLVIFDSKQVSDNFAKELASKYDSTFGKVDIWLDNDLTPVALNRQIRQIIEIGNMRKQIVVMLNNYPASINAMNKFLSSSAASDFDLTPLSSQVKYAE